MFKTIWKCISVFWTCIQKYGKSFNAQITVVQKTYIFISVFIFLSFQNSFLPLLLYFARRIILKVKRDSGTVNTAPRITFLPCRWKPRARCFVWTGQVTPWRVKGRRSLQTKLMWSWTKRCGTPMDRKPAWRGRARVFGCGWKETP